MPPPRSPFAEAITGSGDLSLAGTPYDPASGGGLTLLDARPQGFWGRITAHATANAYGFARVDDGQPATYPNLVGASEVGDGVSLIAYETGLSATVPIGSVVYLTPNRLGPGLSFSWPASSAGASGSATRSGLVLDATYDSTWKSAGLSVTLPGAGTYLLTCTVGGSARLTAGSPGYIFVQLNDDTAGAPVPYSFAVAVCSLVDFGGSFGAEGSGTISVQYTTPTANAVVTLQAERVATGGAVWAVAQIGFNSGGGIQLNFDKVG